ncbi:hypothetical protein JVT61DRAFT_5870 [Boletus reticuloceps]|uniref:BED-type domain-containing protein n=1 Tax=Boletus reticuloceps TaxID=495285 RepID=A0A8I3A8Q4_9AGAM|nr:hypothetical protein JVT61DRAFT_5870 [Boletus reticuloceps]
MVADIISLSSDKDDEALEDPSRLSRLTKGSKRACTNPAASQQSNQSRCCAVPLSAIPQDEAGPDGVLKDFNILDISEAPAQEIRTRDVNEFFAPIYTSENDKKFRNCKKCSQGSHVVPLVAEMSTLRRHLERHHRAEYLQWAEANGFPSMLPKDCKE